MEPVVEKQKRTRVEKKKDGEPREVVVYKIEIAGTNFLYVGHTEDFNQREDNHKAACRHNLNPNSKNKSKNTHLYCEINRNGGWDKVTMSPMEKFVSTGKLESRIREQYWIDKIQVARRDTVMMNACRAYNPPEEYERQRISNNAQCLVINSQKMTCACGAEHVKGYKSNHLKTKKHIEWVKQNETKSTEIVLDEPEV